VFSCRPLGSAILTLGGAWPVRPICANRPEKPGELTATPMGRICPNFRARREPALRTDPPAPASDDVRHIALTKGKFAIVDAADYEWLNQYRWNAFESGGKFYARRSVPGGTILMHRAIMQTPPGMVVDHIDRNGLHNRRANMRNCTPQQNEHNKPPRGARSRFKGVYPHGDKWQAVIKHQGERFYLGIFDNETEAAHARDAKAKELQGPFAYLNFPKEPPA
jgi:hypothetical protein